MFININRIFQLNIFLILFLFVIGITSASSNYKPKIVEPITETWRWQGFPELSGKSCHCMAEGKNGLLYFGVNGGIIQYDGINWQQFRLPVDYTDIPVVTLCVVSDGTIYVGTSKGIKTFKNGKWGTVSLDLNFGDPSDFPYNKFPIIESADKSIWIGACQGAARIKNNKITLYREETFFSDLQNKNADTYKKVRALPYFDIYSIYEDHTGKIWFGLRDGRIYNCLTPSDNVNLTWHRVDSEPGYARARFPLIKMDYSGKVYIACCEKDGGVNIYDKKSWKHLSIKKMFGVDDLHNDIILLKDGTICISGIGRVFFVRNNQWKMYERTELPFPSNRLRVFETVNKNLWIIGLSNDVWRVDLSFNKWITYTDLLFQTEDKKGDRWFITIGGTVVKSVSRTGEWIQYDVKDGLIDAPIAVFATKDGGVWVAGSHEHVAAVAYLNGENWIKQTYPKLSWGIDRRALLEAKDGSLWFGTCSDYDNNKEQLGGLIKLNRARTNSQFFDYVHYPNNDDFRLYGIYGIGQTSDENIWVGQLGFYMLNHSTNKWEKISQPVGLMQNFIDCIQTGMGGDLWVGTRTNGLFYLNSKTKKWKQYTTQNGLSSNSVLDILCQEGGSVWIATDRDISHFDGTTWTNNIFPNVFQYLRDGTSIKSSGDGSLWINQNPSVWYRRALYKENYLRKSSEAFKTVRYHADKLAPQTVITFSMDRVAQPGNVILSWGANDPWKLTPTDQIQYSYRFDKGEWSAYSSKKSEIFLSIASGNHTFEVRGRNRDLNIDATPAKVGFYVEPPVWKEPWFVVLIISFLATIVAFINHLYHRNKIIEELSDTRVRLFTNISHELRTPLTLIMGSLVKILQLSETNKNLREPLNLMQRNSKRLLRLVNQILDYRKIEVGQMKFEPSKGDIVDFIHEEFLSFISEAEAKKVELTFQSEVEHYDVWFDPDKIEKIMFNLIGNAIKFTPTEKTVSVEIKLLKRDAFEATRINNHKIKEVNNWINIIVADTGIGIAKSNLDKIFDSFYQVQDHSAKISGGTGIGLSVAKEMVKLHLGEINVESTLGVGTTFSVKIPVINQEMIDGIVNAGTINKAEYFLEQEVVVESGEVNSEPDNGRSKILIVEDNIDMRQFIRSELYKNYEVMEAIDGIDGFEKALSFGPDLIVSDIMMPRMDGIELCRKTKSDERTSHIAIILLTARTNQEDLLAGLETGADDYLSKPFNSEELKLRIHNIIETRKKIREKFGSSLKLEPKSIAITSVDQKLIERAIEIIEQHMDDEDFSVETFSNLIGMNRVSLYHKIKSLTNLSPREFFTLIRLKRASQLLKESGLSITEIAYQVGFKDSSHFSKLFRKQFGQSPKEYMKEHTN
jgi:signal transduction histidine kinase/DNA-binding response OmpR family regulator/ligand-binding sensor domain-containing protein